MRSLLFMFSVKYKRSSPPRHPILKGRLLNKNLMLEFGTEQNTVGNTTRKEDSENTYGYDTYYHPVFRIQLAILSGS